MKKVTVYTKNSCIFCITAKTLLKMKKISFTEIDISNNPEMTKEMFSKSNGSKTVPQIFFGENHIGGCTDLIKLNNSGKIEELLKD